jgi:hypothetical protein
VVLILAALVAVARLSRPAGIEAAPDWGQEREPGSGPQDGEAPAELVRR